MTFTVSGAYSGSTYAVNVDERLAAAFAHGHGFADAPPKLEGLAVGESWKSHEDARGVKITRTA